MANKLTEICDAKREHVARRKGEVTLAELESAARAQTPPRAFRAALDAKVAAGGYGLIAEIKKASPSKGLIRADFDPPAHARAYRAGGAACLSVLTDAPYFQGSDAYLVAARAATDLPCLRKDFMVDPWQVVEARALGADAILIIVAALADHEMAEIEAAAIAHGMDVLVEVHDTAELERALRLQTRLIGVNNRDLRDFSVDFSRTYELVDRAPAGCTFVAESGLGSRSDLDAMAARGVRCFLVGEALMRHADLTDATRRLLTGGGLTHLDAAGSARMVDVSAKPDTAREATAAGRITMSADAVAAIRAGTVKKGDVLAVARVAGIMAAKRTADLIPLCHPIPITGVTLDLTVEDDGVTATATVRTTHATGVEMEALTAVSTALLTVYDMAKAIDRGMTIGQVRLLAKSGGHSGDWRAA